MLYDLVFTNPELALAAPAAGEGRITDGSSGRMASSSSNSKSSRSGTSSSWLSGAAVTGAFTSSVPEVSMLLGSSSASMSSISRASPSFAFRKKSFKSPGHSQAKPLPKFECKSIPHLQRLPSLSPGRIHQGQPLAGDMERSALSDTACSSVSSPSPSRGRQLPTTMTGTCTPACLLQQRTLQELAPPSHGIETRVRLRSLTPLSP
mmetsp:Transcript_52517/g.162988  ORF Transcript_52517/g.162988 Transcript_52517/m.162988 type:complete len:206 (-) Transcript_52517:84-701(-)